MKNGFTLSEILIALTVVGIISAVTVPVTISNYQRKALVLDLKKAYLDMDYNLTILQSENLRGKLSSSRFGKTKTEVRDFLNENFKVTKNCDETAQPCFASSYKSISKTSEDLSLSGGSCILTKSGYALYVIPAPDSSQPAVVYIDVNGAEPPNTGGRDMFKFNIYEDYSIDVISPDEKLTGTAKTTRETLFTKNCTTSTVGQGCIGKLINDDWKINY